MSNKKVVSKKYAINNFKTIGLCLIAYCLIVLYLPLALNNLVLIKEAFVIKGISTYYLISYVCLILGTLIPFSFMRLYSKKKLSDFTRKTDISFKDIVINFVVFFTFSTLSIYLTTMLSEILTVEGQLVSGIGITFNSEYMKDYLYLFAFIILTPILEEYAFRGVLLNSLSVYGKYFALISTSIIYAIAHASFIELLPSFIMSIILCKLSLRYKSIIPSLIIHILFNGSMCLMNLIPAKYNMYTLIVLAIILISAIVLMISKKYHFITVKKSNYNNQISLTFFLTYTVIIAILLFVVYSILRMFVA